MLDRLLSRSSPEVPPDVVVPAPPVIDEPTYRFPVVQPRVGARTVIVYEPAPRRPWRLWAFAAVLVALTIGVVLGQAEAFQPVSRGPRAEAAVVPAPVTLSAPLAGATSRVLEVTGTATILRVGSADLGSELYRVTPLDAGTIPRAADGPAGPRLSLGGSGSGPVGAEILLNASVTWSVRLNVEGTLGDLDIRTGSEAPVRIRLASGASTVTLGGRTQRDVKPGVLLTEPGWKTAIRRYDVSVAARVGAVTVGRR